MTVPEFVLVLTTAPDDVRADGWARTGDVVRLEAEGQIFYCDRDKDALKVGGENVSAREVEDVCRTVPGVLSSTMATGTSAV